MFCSILMLGGCAPCIAELLDPVSVKYAPVENFKYAYIPPTNGLTSGTGKMSVSVSESGYGSGSGSSKTKSVNPSDIIAGGLMKEGFIILPELTSELSNETLIVNYGESGRRDMWCYDTFNYGDYAGYAIEVTIQFISAETKQMICSCTAEGQGATEADDIRMAIRRCLSSLFSEEPNEQSEQNE